MAALNSFWKTMDILMGKDYRKTPRDVRSDVEEWVEKVIARKLKDLPSKENEQEAEEKKPKKKKPKPKIEKTPSIFTDPEPDEIKEFFKTVKLPRVVCKFSHPYIRSRLEKLMGSNMVSLTNRAYMQRLQERILEDYAHMMSKRISAREAEEMERVKNLVLTGKIPMSEAPPEMASHPVMMIEKFCNRLIAERRAKLKVLRVNIPRYLYWDDTPDPPSGLSIEKGHVFRTQNEKLCTPPEHFVFITDEEDIENGYMFTPEEYERLKYQSPLIKELKNCETVDEMYQLADKIIGVLKTYNEKKHNEEDDECE